MKDVPSPIEVTNWPQVVALVALLAAFVVIPALLNHLSNRPIKNTLTKNNGGSSVKDYLDRIEARQINQDKRLAALEGTAADIAEESIDDPNP